MTIHHQKCWTLLSLVGIAHWFFGNLYEAIVFGPNWMIDNPKILEHLNAVFVHSNPTVYFMPLTLMAAISIWALTFKNKHTALKRDYRIVSVLVLMITLLTSYIVTCVLSNMFGVGFYQHPEKGGFYGTIWNILNVLRMLLQVSSIYYLFSVYSKLDKL